MLMSPGYQEKIGSAAPERAIDRELPVITILARLYRDSEALPSLSLALDALDYPTEKKDIKLLPERDDAQTFGEALRLGLTARHEVIRAPALGPRTKPKACNYGLLRARGELIVIYDAEDQPETDQLKKAAIAFDAADPRLACVQARLNYYNTKENWLTRLFTQEYSLCFDWLLPALQRLGAPIPLGGAANFFRTDATRRWRLGSVQCHGRRRSGPPALAAWISG